MKHKITVIGGGFSGITAAIELANKGFEVVVLEKNGQIGGRARQFSEQGFTFDMGPSWYWMPDVFESFFNRFGYQVSDFYQLQRLDPAYRVYFSEQELLDIPCNLEELSQIFEKIEAGSGRKLKQFLKEAQYKYELGMKEFAYIPGLSIRELLNWRIAKGALKLNLTQSFDRYVRKYFKHPWLRQLMEFPILFLGAKPSQIPALYSLMNYADLVLGTWYPQGGMHSVIKGFYKLAGKLGVKFQLDTEVKGFKFHQKAIRQVVTNRGAFDTDLCIASADYNHVEMNLLDADQRSYSSKFWEKRVMAPSALIFYLGINKKVGGLRHHNLFFDRSFDQHAQEIYDQPKWPTEPLFYVCCPSKTDHTVAPPDHENLFLLIPVAPALKDEPSIREKILNQVLQRFEKNIGENIRDHILFKRSYAHSNFMADYHAFKGNAYGLANTLSQTAHLRPSIKSKKIKNLYYTGQLTVPGPGIPPAIISGQVVANFVQKQISKAINFS